ncbi:MAG: hypothetical protein HKN87_05715 [Saprospiraceae bacterium]|nr:hypothetical protein [Saprospiraceae bacterium]
MTLATAFATIQYPIDEEMLTAGDTVFVADGSHIGFDNRSASGIAGQPIVFKALGNNCIITGSAGVRDDGINIENVDYNVIEGFTSNNMPSSGNGIRLVLADHCVVRRCTTRNNAERGIFTAFIHDVLIEYIVCSNSIDEHGIYLSNSSDRTIIRYNICHDNNANGIHCNADLSAVGDGISEDFMIYGNVLYDNNQAAGINMDGIINAQVFNNLIYSNHMAQGIALFQIDGAVSSTGARIFNNTIIVPDDGRWGILFINGSHDGAEVYNNIILTEHASRGAIATTSTNNFLSDYNIVSDVTNRMDDNPGNVITLAQWQSQTGQDAHSKVADPVAQIFVNYAAQDFHLANTSQATDMGTSLVSSIVLDDLEKMSQPGALTYDIGCYEGDAGANDGGTQILKIQDPVVGQIYDDASVIYADASINQANVVFRAEQEINLLPDFEVLPNFSFVLDLLPCAQH